MADVNRGNRPLSPHLQVYRLPLTAKMSILHRITGAGLTLGALLVAWQFIAAAIGPGYSDFVDGLLASILGQLILIGSLWALCYHALNGIRHLWWDIGRGFDLEFTEKANYVVLGGSVVLTLIFILAIW
ncbi:succinate dehydrogenase, cytochrome b556 subunit [Pararhodobacter sp. SW119]|uniref:succinate dehydrogenase, cytochrome b556 subunit n=1 Tax=Pararhodobacter sp. SW119 TaxID=2780075 RepID=UPI001AE031FF|nr:succinate dehydrogenase, cytochrome b556 subunit [Pararhodobacter sp. SW119]